MPEENVTPTGTNDVPASEDLGNVPNGSETFRTVPNGSDAFGTVPHSAEGFRTMSRPAERKSDHTLTVRDVARMFETAGVARTERSIVNWCQPNKTGIARLDSYYDPNERRYYITAESVSLAIQEEQSKAARGTVEPNSASGSDAPLRAADSAGRRAMSDAEGDDTEAVRTLRQENLDLKITNRAKDMFIEQLQKERDGFAIERQGYVEKLMTFNHRLGTLESQLPQLSAPDGKATEPTVNPENDSTP